MAPSEPVAIIGTGCRFPGGASSPSKLWELLQQPRDLRQKIPPNRFNPDGFYHPNGSHHGTSNVLHSYLLKEDHRHFDAQFFGIKPSEASSMDPQQRFLLEVVYEGLEAAGQRLEDLQGSSTAVYVGLMCGEYEAMLMQQPEEFPTYTATGTSRSIMANRISYFFDWHGPCMTIDTACSSSLVALHHAVQALRQGESSIAIAAGSNLCLGPEPYIAESKLQMLSPNGRSRMWDADADGYARGDGVAAVVLKLLKNAIADGDDIECVIRETAVNQDGRTRGITMPSSEAQTSLIRMTYTRAGLDLSKAEDRPQFFEAHGTGTPTGDPLEAAAIHRAFFGDGKEYAPLYVGSIKTVIGHTEGTAGLAGVIKASLALQKGKIPPNLWFNRLNPAIEPFYGSLKIPNEAIAWPQTSAVRRASVNSFGFGGTNAHAILESPIHSAIVPVPTISPFVPLTFSAHTDVALVNMLSRYVLHLRGDKNLDARALAYTLNGHRSQLGKRYAFELSPNKTLLENLESHLAFLEDNQVQLGGGSAPKAGPAKILGIFTGQGAQYAGMMKDLYSQSPYVRQRVEEFEQRLAQLPDGQKPTWSLKEELLKSPKDSRVKEAAIAQPLATVVQVILVDLVREAGIQFSTVVGHSSGEIAASYAAGFLRATDAIVIAYLRGLVSSSSSSQPGRMIAVGTSYEDAAELCNFPDFKGRIRIAAVNSSSSLTLSGDIDVIEHVRDIYKDEQKFARLLAVDKAYHSHHMLQFAGPYMDHLTQQNISIQQPAPGSPVWISSVNVERFDEAPLDLASGYWVRNLTEPVLFYQAVTKASFEMGSIDMAIEVGPHPALKGPASQCMHEACEAVVPYTGVLRRGHDAVESFAAGMAKVWTELGQPSGVDFAKLDSCLSCSPPPSVLKGLPPYPWVHERLFWHEARASRIRRSQGRPRNQLLGYRSSEDPGQQFRWHNILTPRELPWLSDHRIQGQRVFPAAGYIAVAVEAAAEISKGSEIRLIELQDLILSSALRFDEEDSRISTLFTLTEIQHLHEEQSSYSSLTARFQFYSAGSQDPSPMLLNAEGRLIIDYGPGSNDTLPRRPELDSNLVEVDQDRLYESLKELGYGYTGPFRALSSLKRKAGAVHGVVSRPNDQEEQLMMHPAMVDSAIQSILLAASWPGDGRLWTLHIPTGIRSITVNPKLTPKDQNSRAFSYTFTTSLETHDGRGFFGNVAVHSASGEHTVFRMEGIRAVPLEEATPELDRRLFTKIAWGLVAPDAVAAVHGEHASTEDYVLAEVLERVAHFYLRQLNDSFSANDRVRTEGQWVGLLAYAHHVVEAVAQGRHVCARPDWTQDDAKTIGREIQRFSENIDLRVMRTIGQNIVSVVRGESSMLEYLRKGDILDDYYANALGTHYTEYVARIAKQISFVHPHLNFLEIGAGTGAATKSIMREIGQSYGSYTFTDISSAFFDTAQATFREHSGKMRFSTLNIEQEIEAQGYQPGTYDVIVASFVLHATRNLESSMRKVRQLLKPGGYLLLLEITNLYQARLGFIFGSLPGWWLGEEPHRRLTPLVGKSKWEEVLRRSGFSGIDSVTPDEDPLPYPVSAIVSQAVDDDVSFLREPLCPSQHVARQSPRKLLILGGTSAPIAKLSRMIRNLIAEYFHQGISHVLSLQDLRPKNFASFDTAVLCLADLDNAVFQDLDNSRFQALKTLFNNAKSILWVTKEATDNNPYHLMSVGFGRSMSMEVPHVPTQYLDLDNTDPGAAITLAEALIRFDELTREKEASWQKSLLWPLEPEISVISDRQLLHRIVYDEEKNHRHNSMRRNITQEALVNEQCPVRISLEQKEYRLLQQTPGSDSIRQGAVRIKTELSTISAIKVKEGSFLHVILGNTDDNRLVACLSDTLATEVYVPDLLVIEYSQSSPGLLTALAQTLIAGAIVEGCSGPLVILEPDEGLASAIRAHAANRPISLVFLTTKANDSGSHYHYIHPTASFADIDVVIPQNCRRIVLGNNSMMTGSRISSWARSRQVEIARWDSSPHAHNPQRPSTEYKYLNRLLCSSVAIAQKQRQSRMDILSLQDLPKLSPVQVPWFNGPVLDWRPITAAISFEPVDRHCMLRADRTYWLVGLSKSLGLSLCAWMIDHGARHVVISSRSPVVDRSTLHSFAKKGANVKVLPCNIVDKSSVVAVHNIIQDSMPPLAGVANGAMVLRDRMLEDMTIEEMNMVINPKVLGSMNLHNIFRTTPLDFFILLSSAIGITGNVGQCNYAVANLFMHGLAAQRRKKGLAASVIVIGVILGVGYVTRETSQSLQDNLKKSGHTWMSEQDFHTLFAEAIRNGSAASPYQSEIVSGLKSPREDEDHLPPWHINPQFSHLIIGSQDSSTSSRTSYEKVPLKLRFLEAQSQESLYEIFREALCDHLVAMLQIDDDIPQSQLLQNTADGLGIDSLNAVDLRSWFMKEAKVDVPVLRILGNSTIGDLLDFTFDLLPVDVAPAKSPNFKPAPVTTSKMKPAIIAPKDQSSNPGAKPSSAMNPRALQTVLEAVIPEADLVTPGLVQHRSLPKVADSKQDMPEPVFSSQSDTSSNDSFSITNDVSTPSSISERSSRLFPRNEPTSVQIQRSEKLSHGQSRFWFLQSYVKDPTTFNITCLFQLQGNLDVAKLEGAVFQIGHRHEALRTAISDHLDGTPQQHVLKHSELKLEKGNWVNPDDVTTSYEALKNHVYDLSGGKLFRTLLLSPTRGSANAHYLIIGYHHINMDGFCLDIILHELEDLYVGRRLQNQPFQYADHAASEHLKRSNGAWDTQLQYWKLTLKAPPDAFPILPFAEAGTRRAMRTYSHVKSSSTVSTETRKLIQEACKIYKISPYHFYLAAYTVLLGRWANISDICVGSSYAGRNDSHLQTSVGLYLNLTPLRLTYDAKEAFSSAMEKTRRLTQEAVVNSEIPFDVLLEELKIERNPTHSPLFQVFINYRPAIDERRTFGNCTLEGKKYEVGRTPYDIMLDVFDGVQSEPTRVELSLQQHLYSQGAANMIARSYKELIATFAKNPQQVLEDAPLFPPAELQRSAKMGSGQINTSEWPSTLLHRLDDIIRKHPSNIAIHSGGNQAMTFDQLERRIGCLYNALFDAAVPFGAPVGVRFQASADWICAMLAILQYGAVYVPLDTRYGFSRIASIIDDCQPAAIFFDESNMSDAEELISGRQKVSIINASCLTEPFKGKAAIRTEPQSTAAILYTSGSTGEPKGIPLSHEGLRNNIESASRIFDVSSSDVVLQQTAFSFDFSLWQIFLALMNGGSLVVVPDQLRRDAVSIAELISNSHVTFTGGTPSEYSSWLRYGISESLRGSQWTRAICGGEAIQDSLLEDFRILGKTDLCVHNIYGPTEVTVFATTCQVDYSKKQGTIPVGRAIPNYTVTILGQDGRSLPPGLIGEVSIGGIGVSSGYINKPEETHRRFRLSSTREEGAASIPFHMTGDEGWLSPDGMLYLRGRIAGDTQIKLRGQRVDLQDIERAIINAAAGSVLEANVSPWTGDHGDVFVAHVVLKPGSPGIDLSNLSSALALPQYMRPAAVLPLDQFPVTEHGKRDRRALQSLNIISYQSPIPADIRLTHAEKRILSIWEKVVPRQTAEQCQITAESDFFMIGGTSLTLLEVQRHIYQEVGHRVELVQLFESSSLGGMAALIDQQTDAAPLDGMCIDWAEEARLSLQNHSTPATSQCPPLGDKKQRVLLTGATGFLGQALLRRLVDDDCVTTVHCVAVRKPEKLGPLQDHPKVQLHRGDLVAPLLGLTEDAAREVFTRCNAIIHNGADVSFMKSYQSLREPNVSSTRELLRLSVVHANGAHRFCFVSTAAVAWLSGATEFAEATARHVQPPADGSLGYAASKWASERLIEQAVERYGLNATIFRPTNITGHDTPEQDIVHNVVRFSRILKAVPNTEGLWDGVINFVSLGQCTGEIYESLWETVKNSNLRYVHLTGPEHIQINNLKIYLEQTDTTVGPYKQLDMSQWIVAAEKAGLNTLTATYLRQQAAGKERVYFTKLLRTE
ncbi:putative Hybrid PKS-NRPS biosynthetic cluster [Aspergillus niger]|nr:putative Hybrid PKS-NRPS biosynthetic cluster [Aspergillus niger]